METANVKLGAVMVTESDISGVVREIAGEIMEDYGDLDMALVGVMDGSVCFLADLIRAFPRSVDMLTARVSSYEGTEPGGAPEISWMPDRERVEGRHILIVEDIVDTGATVALLIERFEGLGAASVNVCALLDKPSRREYDVEVTYAGFDVPDVFLVGYGLDYNGDYRNLRELREMEEGE